METSTDSHSCCSSKYLIGASILTPICIILFTEYGRPIRRKIRQYLLAPLQFKHTQRPSPEMDELKSKLFESLSAKGDDKLDIVEIGAGAGANFKFYPKGSRIVCVEPNRYCEQYLRQNASEREGEIELKELIVGDAETMSGRISAGSVDVVVGTLVMCSVRSPEETLKEILKILKPGGRYYFFEHVHAEPGTQLTLLHRILIPIVSYIMESRIDQDTGSIIEASGFSDVEMQTISGSQLHNHGNDWLSAFFRLLIGGQDSGGHSHGAGGHSHEASDHGHGAGSDGHGSGDQGGGGHHGGRLIYGVAKK